MLEQSISHKIENDKKSGKIFARWITELRVPYGLFVYLIGTSYAEHSIAKMVQKE